MSARPGWLFPLLVFFLLSPVLRGAGPSSVCLDRDGDALPAGAVDRLGTARFRHGGPVNAVAFSPEGGVLASGSEDGSVCLWRLPDGRLLRKLKNTGPRWLVCFLAFSRDGKLLASATEWGRIRFWEPASGKLLRTIDLHPSGNMKSFALSPDGKTVAAGFDDRVLGCWDATTGKKIRQCPKTTEISYSLGYSADGKVLISGDGDRNVRVWDAAGLRRIGDHPSTDPLHRPCVIALSPDGKTFAHAIHDHLEIRDVKTGECRHELRGHGGKISSLVFSANGKMLVSANGRHYREGQPSIRWWDVRTGRLRHAVTDLEGNVLSVALSPDGKILAAGDDKNTVQLWDTASGRPLTPSHGQRGAPQALVYSPDGRLLASVGDDGVILLWDLRSKRPPRRLRGCRGWVASLAFSPDGRLLASAGRDRQVRLWSPTSGEVVRQWTADADDVNAILFSPDGRTLFSGGDEEEIREWDITSGKELRQFQGHKNSVYYLAWSIPGEILLSGSCDGTIRCWNVRAGREVRRWRKGTASLAVSPDGRRLVAQSYEYPMEVWDLEAGSASPRFMPHHGINRLLFSPDGRTLVLGDKSGGLALWEMLTEKPRDAFKGHRGGISCLAFSPDGKRLATGSDDTSILIWDLTRSPCEDANAPLESGELETLWHRLGERDARLVYGAVLRLSAHPAETLPYLRNHLSPVAPAEPQRVERCIAELDDERFAVRERARRQLEELGESAEPLLRRALTQKPTLELRRRIETVLANHPPLYSDNAPPDRLRELRALEVLERIGSAEARRLLAALAAGVPSARLTHEAAAAGKRLDQRPTAEGP